MLVPLKLIPYTVLLVVAVKPLPPNITELVTPELIVLPLPPNITELVAPLSIIDELE